MLNTVRPAMQVRAFSAGRVVFRRASPQTKLEKAGLPIPPRAPGSGFAKFLSDHMAKHSEKFKNMKTESGKYDFVAVSAELAKSWKALPDSARNEYLERAEADRREYAKAFEKFADSLKPGQYAAIERAMGKPLRFPGSKVSYNKKVREATGSPGQPLTPFFIYLAEFRNSSEAQGLGTIEIAKLAGTKWRSLSEQDKESFKQRSLESQKAYKNWKESQGQSSESP